MLSHTSLKVWVMGIWLSDRLLHSNHMTAPFLMTYPSSPRWPACHALHAQNFLGNWASCCRPLPPTKTRGGAQRGQVTSGVTQLAGGGTPF